MSTINPTAFYGPPNPYRFTVEVRLVGIWHQVWVAFNRGVVWEAEEFLVAGFRNKEEADTHAALILAALHQAVIE